MPSSHALLSPIPGVVAGRPIEGGLHFPELSLVIPRALLAGAPGAERYVSPSGHQLRTVLAPDNGCAPALVDRGGLVKMLATEAAGAGATLQFGRAATGLIRIGNQIAGVATDGGLIQAGVVICAEGEGKALCQEAGLCRDAKPQRYAHTASLELSAPRVQGKDMGRLVTFGKRYTSARDGYGAVVCSKAGRAVVSFTLFSDRPNHHTEESARFYLEEYIDEDPRVRDLLAGSTRLQSSTRQTVIRHAQSTLVRDRFVATGDVLAPHGSMGPIAAIYCGRQAALVAAGAIDSGDTSAAGLAGYESLVREPILAQLEAEDSILSGLLRMTDDELDRLCQSLLAACAATSLFSGRERDIPWEALGRAVRDFPFLARDWAAYRPLRSVERRPAVPFPGDQPGVEARRRSGVARARRCQPGSTAERHSLPVEVCRGAVARGASATCPD